MSKFWEISLKNLIIIIVILLLIIFIIISLLYAKKNIKKGSSEVSLPLVVGGSCNLVKRYIHKTGMYSPDINTRLPV